MKKERQTQGNGRRTPTMMDIAKIAGVHQTTVSLALRDHPAISERTRNRIHEIARDLGYAPDPALDAFNFYRLAHQPLRSAPAIAFVTDLESAEWKEATALRELFAGAKAAAEKMGFVFERFHVGPRELSPLRLDGILRSRNIECAILGGLSLRTSELQLDWSRLCALKVESFHAKPDLDVISSNHRQAGRLAFSQLWTLGYRRIGLLLSHDEERRLSDLPRAGYLTECDVRAATDDIPVLYASGPEDPAIEAWMSDYRVDAVVGDSGRLLAALREKPFSARHRTAFAVLDVAGCPDWLAGVELNHAAVGNAAVELLEIRRYIHQYGLPRRTGTTFFPVSWRGAQSAPPRR